jgi:hypothetical protein
MNTILTLIILQFGLINKPSVSLTGSKMYLEDAQSHEIIAFAKVSSSGNVYFSNLDPGNYLLSIEIPSNSVKAVDKKQKQKYDTNIIIGYNKSKKSYNWNINDAYVNLQIEKFIKIADSFVAKYEPVSGKSEENDSSEKGGLFGILKKDKDKDKDKNAGKTTVLQFTVTTQYGAIGLSLNSISQKEFHKLVVGTDDMSLEDQGIAQVLLKQE